MLTRARSLVGGRHLSGEVGVVDVRCVSLRREDRALQRDERRVGRLQPAVDLLIEVHVLLVVVEARPGQQAKPVGDGPLDLAEDGRADASELQVLVEAVAVEQAGRCRGRARRQQEPRGGCALFLLERRVGIDGLLEGERAADDVHARRQSPA